MMAVLGADWKASVGVYRDLWRFGKYFVRFTVFYSGCWRVVSG